MDVERYIEIISGRKAGIVAAMTRGVLWLLSWPYSFVIAFRNRLFDLGVKKIHRVEVPVIAVGNLTTGGTGKTPVVATIVHVLQELELRPGIVSRGYHADESGSNDEAKVLAQLCPDVPHEQNPDRIAAANKLIRGEAVDVIVLDDAFQHRRIHRQLNIVLIDATNPFGFGHQLPRGLLRESALGLHRADLVLVTRADVVSPDSIAEIQDTITTCNPALKDRTHRVSFTATGLLSVNGERRPLEFVNGRRVAICTAIGNPQAFVETCRTLNADVVATTFFPDHHHYTPADRQRIHEMARGAEVDVVLTTLKDLVKMSADQNNIWAVQIESVFQPEAAKTQFRDALLRATEVGT